jgi:hypothetical protein
LWYVKSCGAFGKAKIKVCLFLSRKHYINGGDALLAREPEAEVEAETEAEGEAHSMSQSR